MTSDEIKRYQQRLLRMAGQTGGAVASLEDDARASIGGSSSGNLSSTPMHLADLGSEAYTQELNATLLENEEHILHEIREALDRIDRGTFGLCENCQKQIIKGRLDAMPYARYCTPCAEQLHDGRVVNMDDGRPREWSHENQAERDRAKKGTKRAGTEDRASANGRDSRRHGHSDVHAAGTAGGGTAIGGLAGTNIGAGDPQDSGLEEAMGSGQFDVEIEGDEHENEGYGGPTGGAVGGTPAGKRAVGGKKSRSGGAS